MRQLYRAHAVLLVCAYVGFLGYHAATDPNDPVVALLGGAARLPQSEAAASATVVKTAGPSRSSSPASAVARNDAGPVVQPDPANQVSDEMNPTGETEEAERKRDEIRLSEVRLQAIRAVEPQRRAEAIDQLNSATPETLQALQAVVTSDSTARNRIRALNSLRIVAAQEDAKDAVLTIVQLATTDTNASVASRAADVYRELTREQTEGE